jgi:hypothetical protein
MVIPRVLGAIAVVSVALVAAGCGGSKSPSVASLGPASSSTTTTTDSGSDSGSSDKPQSLGSALKYVHCMQKHGIHVQVGNGGRTISINGGPGKGSAQMQQAQQACSKLLPGGGPKAMSPEQQAKVMKQLVALAKCMRKHGVPNFPDPTPGPGGGFGLNLKQTVDPSSPQFQRAAKACGSTGPGGKGFGIRFKAVK